MSRTLLAACSSFFVIVAVTSIAAEPDAKPIPGVGPAGEVVRLHTGFKFVEGPAVDAYENVFFTDIPNNRILKVDALGELSTFLEHSDAINGLMFDRRGRLIACQGKRQRLVAIDTASKQITPLAEKCDGKPLGTPNDLVIDREGGVYFTAPDTQAVHYVDAQGTVVRLIDNLPRPNGVILSPDEATLYVLPSGSGEVMSYPVKAPGQIGEGKVFCQLVPNPNNPSRPGGDGLTVDSQGNLYLTRPSMKFIQVVDPKGKTLGLLHFPEEPSNCTFGGADGKTLFVTGQTSLYSQRLETAGHCFSASQQESWDYAEPMKKVAANFRGKEGVVIHVGGSMTIANPYGTWARSGKGKTGDDQAILSWMHLDKKDKTDGWWLCRTELEHYRAYTSESGLKSAMLLAGGRRGLPPLEKLLDQYQPQMVTIECGIYDVEDGVPLEEYRANMAKAVDVILAHGAIPVLNTIPPFKAEFAKTRRFNVALRRLAKERGIPVIDLEAEIFSLRPDDWYNKLMDRIHLTAAQAGGSPSAEPTTENLRNSGYLLRGWLTVRKIAEIKHRVIDKPARLSARLPQKANTWVKRSPLEEAPISPGLSYETSLAYDPVARRVIRWGGHAQGGVKGSGEQIAELWLLDPATMQWELRQPNRSPPPVCCAQQNVFDTAQNRFLRFKSFSGSHGWQWYRELYLNNSSVWSYDPSTNTWRDLRPLPEPSIGSLRCASWDSDQHVAVVFGGEGRTTGTVVFDPYTNTWTRMQPKDEPPLGSRESRSGGNMAYDAARKLHVLFGSQFSNDRHTWAFDLKKNQWYDLKPARQPPTNRNDAVLAYDSLNKVIVAVVRAGEEFDGEQLVNPHLETWSFDTQANNWTRLNVNRQPDPIGARSRVMTFVPDQNLFLMDGYAKSTGGVSGVHREHQIWTYRYAEAPVTASTQTKPTVRKQPRIVEDVLVSVVSAKEVHLAWQPPAGEDVVAGYHVERAVVEVLTEDEIVRLKKDTPPLAEPSVGAIKYIGPFQRLTQDPLSMAQFTDRTIDLAEPQSVEGEPLFRHRFGTQQLDSQGKPYRFAVYAYRVRAINAEGVESGPSPYFLTIPAAPQNLFSREDGKTCHLKWSANTERGLQGYRVYAMKGPRPEGPGQPTVRLTADPIAEPGFSDPQAGDQTRRYWVVAVDALGQEGIPSSPTWHYRTQRDFYVPFVGEWHQ